MEDWLYKYLKYYKTSPQWIKRIVGQVYRTIPLSIRYGKVYTEYTKLLEESQWWSKEKLQEYQWRKLEKLLAHAYKNVPYYRRIFNERGLKLRNIQNFDDFKQIPFLTKEIVRNNLESLIAKNYPKSRALFMTTSGSTATPLGFYYEKCVARSKELAFIVAQWSRVGYRVGDRLAVLMGNVIKGVGSRKFWEYEPIKNRLILSPYHMMDKNMRLYVEKIRKYKPKFFHGYPSALVPLANFMKKNKIPPFPSIKAILSASESIYPWQIKLFEEIFQCKVSFWYGLRELVTLAGTCEYSHYYHVYPEYSYVELIDEKGNPVTQEGAMGEVVGTTFDNDIMPFIRYKTQDLAVHTEQKCKCGRNYPLWKRIEGRLQDFIYTKSNELVSLRPGISGFLGVDWLQVKQVQFVQEKKGELIIRILRYPQFSKEEVEKYVLGLFETKFKGVCDIRVTFVDEVIRTKSGKCPYLIQKLPIQWANSKDS